MTDVKESKKEKQNRSERPHGGGSRGVEGDNKQRLDIKEIEEVESRK